jgi:catechol 2,3-dioxygenase-like lactoylglutathione lyase family enzyme
MKIEFISSFAVVTRDPVTSRRLYVDTLGLPLEQTGASDSEYYASEHIPGSRHFGVWPLAEAAQACFGTTEWPATHPVPQTSVEFDVGDEASVGAAAQELADAGYTLLHGARTEPWGQTVARLQDADGAIVGISYAPWMHTS